MSNKVKKDKRGSDIGKSLNYLHTRMPVIEKRMVIITVFKETAKGTEKRSKGSDRSSQWKRNRRLKKIKNIINGTGTEKRMEFVRVTTYTEIRGE